MMEKLLCDIVFTSLCLAVAGTSAVIIALTIRLIIDMFKG